MLDLIKFEEINVIPMELNLDTEKPMVLGVINNKLNQEILLC